jgi:peptide/nickel transport system permease protein
VSTPDTTSTEQVVTGTELTGAAPSGRRAGSVGSASRKAFWLVKRLIGGIFVLWATATVIFILQALTETNRAKSVIQQLSGSSQNPSKADVNNFNHQFGINHSVIHQYFTWIAGLAHGNFGISYFQHQAVTTIIGREIGATMVLTFTALALAWIIAVTVTVLAAGRNNFFSRLGTGFQLVAASLPSYWVGTILLLIFALDLGWFPVEGATGITGLVLPAITLALPVAGFMGQVIEDEFVAVLAQPFVTSARSRGMSDFGVRTRHVLRHAILPALTLSGWAVGYLFSGAVLVESVFARPGIGTVLVTAANEGDVPVVSGVVVVSAAVYVLANIAVDAAYTLVDPRLKAA